jgi:hypothetical protein
MCGRGGGAWGGRGVCEMHGGEVFIRSMCSRVPLQAHCVALSLACGSTAGAPWVRRRGGGRALRRAVNGACTMGEEGEGSEERSMCVCVKGGAGERGRCVQLVCGEQARAGR